MAQTTLINDIYGVVGSQGEITDLNVDGKNMGLVRAVTSPGGGIASLTAGAYPLWLQGASLLDRVPLPRMRPIMTPRDVDLAAATIPAGASISIESAPDEMYGECIRIDLPSGLTTTTGRIHLPIRQLVGVGFPRALLRSELRIHVDDWSRLGACLFYLSQSAPPSSAVGHQWTLRASDGSSYYGITGPHMATAWNNQWRTLQLSAWQKNGISGAPAPFDRSSPEFETKTVSITVSTTAACTLRINRVASPEWVTAGIITQGDGGHLSWYDTIGMDFRRRGWPAVISRGAPTASEDVSPRIPVEIMREMDAMGWLTMRHLQHWVPGATDSDPTGDSLSFEEVPTTAAELAEFQQRWLRLWSGRGYPSVGFAYASCLRNQHPQTLDDGASVLRASGMRGCRGRMSDAQFGVHPGHSGTVTTGLGTPMQPIVPGWSPRWGRFNRMYIDGASSSADTPAARDMYSGSHLEEAILRTLASIELTWWYTHRIQTLTETTPAADQNGPRFAADFVAHMDELVRADKAIPLTPLQADLLTYDRPGDVYMDWSGAWRSRTTGKVVL